MAKYLRKDVVLILLTYIVMAASVGVFFPFNALYLSSTLNFSNAQLSFMDGFGQLLAMFFLPFAGLMSDKLGRPGLIFVVLMAGSGILMFLYSQQTEFVFVAFFYMSFLMLRRGVFPILDALTLNICETYDLNFGIFRSVYSGCFMIFAIGVGFLFQNEVTVDNSFIYYSVAFNCIVIILAFFLPRFNVPNKEKIEWKQALPLLLKDKGFMIVSVAVSLAMATVSIVAMYNATIISELGGKVESIGLATIMQMGSEVIFALFVFKLAKKYGHLNIMMFGMIILVIRWLIVALFFTFNTFYFSIWIEGFSVIFILIIGMDYIKNIVLPQLIATSITLYTSITLLFYAILVNMSGYIRDVYSTPIMFYFLTIISIISVVVIIYSKKIKSA